MPLDVFRRLTVIIALGFAVTFGASPWYVSMARARVRADLQRLTGRASAIAGVERQSRWPS